MGRFLDLDQESEQHAARFSFPSNLNAATSGPFVFLITLLLLLFGPVLVCLAWYLTPPSPQPTHRLHPLPRACAGTEAIGTRNHSS
jgi:hypothetical protein